MGVGWLLELAEGCLSPYPHAENEVELRSTKRDPAALRFAVDEDQVEHNLGKDSWNTRRVDSGIHDEHAYVQGQLYRGPDGGVHSGQGTIELCVRGPGKEQAEQRLLVREDAILCLAPISAPNIGAGNELRAPGGVYWVAMQGDGGEGKLVMYKNSIPGDYNTGFGKVVARWETLP